LRSGTAHQWQLASKAHVLNLILHYIFWFALFSSCFSALNLWTLCTLIVISHETAHFGAGGSSRSPFTNMTIHAWWVCEVHRKDVVIC
jgi:hypothetical protein